MGRAGRSAGADSPAAAAAATTTEGHSSKSCASLSSALATPYPPPAAIDSLGIPPPLLFCSPHLRFCFLDTHNLSSLGQFTLRGCRRRHRSAPPCRRPLSSHRVVSLSSRYCCAKMVVVCVRACVPTCLHACLHGRVSASVLCVRAHTRLSHAQAQAAIPWLKRPGARAVSARSTRGAAGARFGCACVCLRA